VAAVHDIIAVQLSFQVTLVPVLMVVRRIADLAVVDAPPLGDVDSWREFLREKLKANSRRPRTNLRQLRWWVDDDEFIGIVRPRLFGDCEREGYGTVIPCPWYSCRYHLGIDDVATKGSRTTFRTGAVYFRIRIEPEDLDNHETCSMRLANDCKEKGEGMQVDEVAEVMKLSPGSVEAVERVAKWKLSTMLDGNVKDWE
jgi:hypothetical protein